MHHCQVIKCPQFTRGLSWPPQVPIWNIVVLNRAAHMAVAGPLPPAPVKDVVQNPDGEAEAADSAVPFTVAGAPLQT